MASQTWPMLWTVVLCCVGEVIGVSLRIFGTPYHTYQASVGRTSWVCSHSHLVLCSRRILCFVGWQLLSHTVSFIFMIEVSGDSNINCVHNRICCLIISPSVQLRSSLLVLKLTAVSSAFLAAALYIVSGHLLAATDHADSFELVRCLAGASTKRASNTLRFDPKSISGYSLVVMCYRYSFRALVGLWLPLAINKNSLTSAVKLCWRALSGRW